MSYRTSARVLTFAIATLSAAGVARAGSSWEVRGAQTELLERLHAGGSLLGPAGPELARATVAATSLTEIRSLAAQAETLLSVPLRLPAPFDRASLRLQGGTAPFLARPAPTSGLSAHGQVAPQPRPGQTKYPMRGTWLPSPDAD